MRISTAWAQQNSINAMNSQQAKLANLLQQLSSGLKINTPADDPAAAAKVLDLNMSIDQTNQYQKNIATAQGRLNIEGSALTSATSILNRAQELTTQAMNPTMNSSDMLSIKTEVDQLMQQMAGVANTKNANGEYIFSGGQALAPSFIQDPITGTYGYQGGTQQRVLQISQNRQISDSDLGGNVFQNIKSSSPAADQNGNRSVFDTLKSLSDSLAGTFASTPGAITGSSLSSYGFDYTLTTAKFNLVSTSPVMPATVPATTVSTASAIDLTGKKFTSLAALVTEINNQSPTGIKAQANGSRLEFVTTGTGSTNSVQINNTTGTFLSDTGFTNGQTKAGSDLPLTNVFQTLMGNVLTDIATAQDSFLQAQTSVGTRLNALDSQSSQNGKFVLDAQTTLSQTQDLDYADAMSKFQLETIALQASQQAFAKVKGMSLFNYL